MATEPGLTKQELEKVVADYRSFHKAANAIHYAQSTVSAQIMTPEEELGVRLFERLGRRII